MGKRVILPFLTKIKKIQITLKLKMAKEENPINQNPLNKLYYQKYSIFLRKRWFRSLKLWSKRKQARGVLNRVSKRRVPMNTNKKKDLRENKVNKIKKNIKTKFKWQMVMMKVKTNLDIWALNNRKTLIKITMKIYITTFQGSKEIPKMIATNYIRVLISKIKLIPEQARIRIKITGLKLKKANRIQSLLLLNNQMNQWRMY